MASTRETRRATRRKRRMRSSVIEVTVPRRGRIGNAAVPKTRVTRGRRGASTGKGGLPKERRAAMIERIVVPLDGSLTAEAILPQVRRILHRHDSELVLVRAVVPVPVENSILIADAASQGARQYLHGVQERLDREGVRVQSEIRVGAPIS